LPIQTLKFVKSTLALRSPYAFTPITALTVPKSSFHQGFSCAVDVAASAAFAVTDPSLALSAAVPPDSSAVHAWFEPAPHILARFLLSSYS